MRVGPLPSWLDRARLLGPGDWHLEGDQAEAVLETTAAADLAARLRGLGFGGRAVEVAVSPPLKRAAVRAGRTRDARRRRDTTPGFTRRGVRLDAEGRTSLTPEALALRIGQRYAGQRVIDATCGVGGNAIGFARAGCAVVAVERDRGRLGMAAHNARIYGVALDLRLGDARALVPTLAADLLFVDPPWGADWDRRRTSLTELPLLAALAARWSGPLLAKVPPSLVPPDGWAAEAWFGEAAGDARRVKFLLIRREG